MNGYHVDVNDKALEHFNLKRDPCNWLPEKVTDYFYGDDMGFVDMVLWRAIHLPGIAAIVGEVGCGKSSAVRRFVAEELTNKNDYTVSVIDAPQMRHLDMSHICRKMLYDMATKDKSFHSMGFMQTAEAVRDFVDSLEKKKQRPVLIIEDAHLLGLQPLRELKLLYELRHSIQHTLAIILVAQRQLYDKLDHPDTKQLAQRCRVHEMQGLKKDLAAYVKHRFKRANAKREATDLFEPDALKLLAASAQRQEEVTTPLEVNAWCARMLNRTWQVGKDRVPAEIAAAVLAELSDNGEGEVLMASPAVAASGKEAPAAGKR